jgi:type II secretory pathway component PulM
MMPWWSERSRRERIALGSMAALVVLMALFQFGVKPLVSWRESAQADYEAALALLAQIETGAQAIQAVSAETTGRSTMPARTAVAAVASEHGLAITRLQPLENGDLDIGLDDVNSPTLFKWLAALSERHGLMVARASLQRGDNGTVRAQITLAGGSSP